MLIQLAIRRVGRAVPTRPMVSWMKAIQLTIGRIDPNRHWASWTMVIQLSIGRVGRAVPTRLMPSWMKAIQLAIGRVRRQLVDPRRLGKIQT